MQSQVGEIAVYAPDMTFLDLDDDAPDPSFDRSSFDALKASL